jgi:aspartate carbamoyltransferase catalytic subunit
MQHFLDIESLSSTQVIHLLQRAQYFKKERNFPVFNQCRLANLFYENSTRTRVSFELAATHLSIPVINLDLASSSESKGEVILDTVKNLVAMGINLLVIRHHQNSLQHSLATQLGPIAHIINAGDGQHAHPSQALLDVMTIIEKKPNLRDLKIAIIGNIRHSRVANSLQRLFALLGVGQLKLVAPQLWLPEKVFFGETTESLQTGISDADVVICLRIQNERLTNSDQIDRQAYREGYALTKETLSFAKSDALVMHPGPINRGMEIDSDIADGPQSCILQQVHNGVFMRMAIIESLLQ